jgi:hypothetical protein
MGLFWRWDFIGAVTALMYSTGIAVMYGGDYKLAAAFYIISISWLTTKTITWETVSWQEKRSTIAALIAVIGLVILAISLGWDGYRFVEIELAPGTVATIDVPKIIQRLSPSPPSEPKPRLKSSQPIQPPPPQIEVTQIAPSYGNLRTRTLQLAEAIKIFVQSSYIEERKIPDFPNLTGEEAISWANHVNFIFKSQIIFDVNSIHDELATRGFKDFNLEETLDVINDRIKLQSNPAWDGHAPIAIQDIQRISDRLFVLGNLVPDQSNNGSVTPSNNQGPSR